MSKVILEIDKPIYCSDCPCYNDEFFYCKTDEMYRDICPYDEVPQWCPLQEIDDEVLKQLGIEE